MWGGRHLHNASMDNVSFRYLPPLLLGPSFPLLVGIIFQKKNVGDKWRTDYADIIVYAPIKQATPSFLQKEQSRPQRRD